MLSGAYESGISLKKNVEYTGFFCQLIPSWLLISGAKACYFPTCNLNLLNRLQTHLFHVAQWEKLSTSAPSAFLFYSSRSESLCPLGAASSLFHRNSEREHL